MSAINILAQAYSLLVGQCSPRFSSRPDELPEKRPDWTNDPRTGVSSCRGYTTSDGHENFALRTAQMEASVDVVEKTCSAYNQSIYSGADSHKLSVTSGVVPPSAAQSYTEACETEVNGETRPGWRHYMLVPADSIKCKY